MGPGGVGRRVGVTVGSRARSQRRGRARLAARCPCPFEARAKSGARRRVAVVRHGERVRICAVCAGVYGSVLEGAWGGASPVFAVTPSILVPRRIVPTRVCKRGRASSGARTLARECQWRWQWGGGRSPGSASVDHVQRFRVDARLQVCRGYMNHDQPRHFCGVLLSLFFLHRLCFTFRLVVHRGRVFMNSGSLFTSTCNIS